jgi:hypothetical protein
LTRKFFHPKNTLPGAALVTAFQMACLSGPAAGYL